MLELAYGLELVLGEMRIVQLLVPDRTHSCHIE